MRTSRFTDSQILSILKQNETGVAVDGASSRNGINRTLSISRMQIAKN